MIEEYCKIYQTQINEAIARALKENEYALLLVPKYPHGIENMGVGTITVCGVNDIEKAREIRDSFCEKYYISLYKGEE